MRLKKLLALLLAAALLLSGMVTAGATVVETPGLVLKEVERIEAEWIGGSVSPDFGFEIAPWSTRVTLHYSDGSSEALDSWGEFDDDSGVWWKIDYRSDWDDDWSTLPKETNVTLYYCDSALFSACDGTYSEFLETVPQTGIKVQLLALEDYFALFAAEALELGGSAAVELDEGAYQLFTFTPEKSGHYYFYSGTTDDTNPLLYLYNEEYELIAVADDGMRLGRRGRDFALLKALNKGETYYLLTTTYSVQGGSFTLHADRRISRYNSAAEHYLYYYLGGGWLFNRLLEVDYDGFSFLFGGLMSDSMEFWRLFCVYFIYVFDEF